MMVMLVLCALGAMLGLLAVRGASTELRSAGVERTARLGFYCAEAGLEQARGYFSANYSQWSAMFGSGTPPAGYPVTGDVDGDGVPDYRVTLRDDVDELPPLTNDPLHDNNLTAVMISRCINPDFGNRQLESIVRCNVRGTDYRYQSGHGSSHAGNEN
jgi:hypothetical protein